MRPHAEPASRILPDTPCAHCGLPVGRHPVGTGPVFCCTGCATVYATLKASGLGETFYRLRDQSASTSTLRPSSSGVDPLVLSELDSERFLETHTHAHADGTRSVDLFLDGVHCTACVWLVERMPFELAGVLSARLDLPRSRVTVRWDPRIVPLSDVARWLSEVGYRAHPRRRTETGRTPSVERALLRRVGVCWALAGNVMLLSFALYAGLESATNPGLATAARWLSLLLALPALLYGGSVFFRKAWTSIRHSVHARSVRLLHMDVPIALGLTIGFGHSAWATVTGTGEVWFDSVTVLIAALLTARWLQVRSRRYAGEATERLLALIPSMVHRISADGSVSVVPGDTVRVDDLVDIPAEETIPVDGLVVSGRSTVNNAVLTGESRPQIVEPGARVSAGAANLSAPIQVRVTAAGTDTRVGALLAWIQDAASQRAPIILLANRLSAYFVITVLSLATLTALFWVNWAPDEAVQHVVALLVVTCPCALGMATPLTMAVAAGRAARSGLFIKSDEATQRLTEIDCVVLDKTGTLTEGRFDLIDYVGSDAMLDRVIRLEQLSSHPLANALMMASPRCDLYEEHVEDFESVTGQGVRGTVEGVHLTVGRPDWIASIAGSPPSVVAEALTASAKAGHTPVGIAANGAWAGALRFGDRVRPEARDVVKRLQRKGKTIFLLSGDHPEVARQVAYDLGLPATRTVGHASPERKRAFVEALRNEGYVVAMVGDGVNDAVALRAADVGVAVQGGSSVSHVAADVFLTCAGVAPLLTLFDGSERVMARIRLLLGLSLFYNLFGAAAAFAGIVTPLVAAVAMPVSSLLVVLLSITARTFPS